MGYKPLEQQKAYQQRQAALKKKQLKTRAHKQTQAMARRAKKDAIEKLAEETFGEGGLTPARQEALAAIVAGPDQTITISSPAHLKQLIKRARERFTEKAEEYIDSHAAAVKGALKAEQFDVAARHAEWALEAFGDSEERVIEKAAVKQGNGPTPIMVGVNLGGVTQKG